MSQDSHREYKVMCKLKSRYLYTKRNNYSDGIVKKDRYDYLKSKLEYLTIDKHDDWYERLSVGNSSWGLTPEAEKVLQYKMENDTELVLLRRTVKLLKIQLLRTGYNKIYL